MEAAVISEQGLRPEMEDAHYLDLDFGGKGWVFGEVYDGHGGSYAAEYASRRLHRVFLEKILAGDSPQQAFIHSYQATSEELKTQDSGATAVSFFIREHIIYTANAGDARAIVVGESGWQQLTVDHRLDDPSERERVTRMGGIIQPPYVYRGSMGLMPTRTIGDAYFKPVGIIATPSVSEHPVSEKDAVLLAACDGLFDFMSNEEVAGFAHRYPRPRDLLEALKQEVLLTRRGTDNLTVIAVALK